MHSHWPGLKSAVGFAKAVRRYCNACCLIRLITHSVVLLGYWRHLAQNVQAHRLPVYPPSFWRAMCAFCSATQNPADWRNPPKGSFGQERDIPLFSSGNSSSRRAVLRLVRRSATSIDNKSVTQPQRWTSDVVLMLVLAEDSHHGFINTSFLKFLDRKIERLHTMRNQHEPAIFLTPSTEIAP